MYKWPILGCKKIQDSGPTLNLLIIRKHQNVLNLHAMTLLVIWRFNQEKLVISFDTIILLNWQLFKIFVSNHYNKWYTGHIILKNSPSSGVDITFVNTKILAGHLYIQSASLHNVAF